MRQAIYILMEYNGEISYRTPAHITTDFNPDGSKDYDKVMAAIEELKVKHYIQIRKDVMSKQVKDILEGALSLIGTIAALLFIGGVYLIHTGYRLPSKAFFIDGYVPVQGCIVSQLQFKPTY